MTHSLPPNWSSCDQTLGDDPTNVIRHLAERSPPPDAPPKSKPSSPTPSPGKEDRDRRARRHRDPALPIDGGHRTDPRLGPAPPPVDFGAKDGPADLVFFIAAPEGADQEHLSLLSKLARSLIKKDFGRPCVRRRRRRTSSNSSTAYSSPRPRARCGPTRLRPRQPPSAAPRARSVSWP